MSITATRIGHSSLTLDWSQLLMTSSPSDHMASNEAWQRLKSRFEKGEVGFFDTPRRNELSQLKESVEMAQNYIKSGLFKDCLFLGIGGSALGPSSLLTALPEKCTTGIRFHFMENPDPLDWRMTLQGLNPETTLICAVTKSGTTFETMSLLLLALDWTGQKRWTTHVLAITDPEKGDLRTFVKQQKIPSLIIHPSIGGRFSLFSPVGLFPAALAGMSAEALMAGANEVSNYVEKTAIEKNPLFLLGAEFIRRFNERPIHVCMPYSTRLRAISAWFVQLWGESLGKDRKGFTPLAAVGATDQHSILQLLRDGPDDKITFFITVDEMGDPVKIPRLPFNLPSFVLLGGQTLHQLLTTEYQATAQVLTRQNRPHLTLRMDRLDEKALGALYMAFSILTAVTGELWHLNPFDQPGVEEGKIYIRESLTRDRQTAQDDDGHSAVSRLRRDN